MTLMLGDLLAMARDQSGRFAQSLRRYDPQLAERLAESEGVADLGAAARSAVERFSRQADEERWATLISRVRDADDPAHACLTEIVRYSTERPACNCHEAGVKGGE